jgi:hypothetical protein
MPSPEHHNRRPEIPEHHEPERVLGHYLERTTVRHRGDEAKPTLAVAARTPDRPNHLEATPERRTATE